MSASQPFRLEVLPVATLPQSRSKSAPSAKFFEKMCISLTSKPLSSVLLTRFEHPVDNTGDPLHHTPEGMLLGFALRDFFLVIRRGFGIPSGLRQRNQVKDTIEVSIPFVILH